MKNKECKNNVVCFWDTTEMGKIKNVALGENQESAPLDVTIVP